jgi:hypothetical protein
MDVSIVCFVMLMNLQNVFCCTFAKLIWRTIQYIFNVSPLANVTNMIGNWLNGVDKNPRNKSVQLCFDRGYLELE